jgi:hypothetical protein
MQTFRRQHEPLWDSFLYPAAAGPVVQRLFAPRQGVNNYQTNLTKDGSLSGQNAFTVRAVRFLPHVAADPRDVLLLMDNVTRINVNDVDLGMFHGWDIPAGAGVSLQSDQGGIVLAVAHTYASNGEPNIKNIRVLADPFTIQPNEAFFTETEWQAIAVLQAATRFWIYLDGTEVKPRI